MSRIPVAILGPTGYTGLELIELILSHPTLSVGWLGSARENPPSIVAEFPRLAGRLAGMAPTMCAAIDHDAKLDSSAAQITLLRAFDADGEISTHGAENGPRDRRAQG